MLLFKDIKQQEMMENFIKNLKAKSYGAQIKMYHSKASYVRP